MVPLKNRPTLDQQMEAHDASINSAVKRRIPKSEFIVKSIPRQQIRRKRLLANRVSALHTTWSSLDRGRRSAACRFEWARLQIFMAAEVLPRLQELDTELVFLTLADKRWRVAPTTAVDAFKRPRRKLRAAIQSLRDQGFKPVFVVAYEISGDRNLEANYAFEPHAHVLIGGVPEPALKAAFNVRLPRIARGRDKPISARSVSASQIGNILGYLTKMKAQDRVEFVRSDGRRDRTSNRMTLEQETLWLRCMAATPIAQVIQFGGFAESMTSRFIHCEMATMIGDMK